MKRILCAFLALFTYENRASILIFLLRKEALPLL